MSIKGGGEALTTDRAVVGEDTPATSTVGHILFSSFEQKVRESQILTKTRNFLQKKQNLREFDELSSTGTCFKQHQIW